MLRAHTVGSNVELIGLRSDFGEILGEEEDAIAAVEGCWDYTELLWNHRDIMVTATPAQWAENLGDVGYGKSAHEAMRGMDRVWGVEVA
ncbi:hypothetical protein LCGC14_0730800 [marine sediment metagenome]|uniref:Uncharacterized protein n=1 Tax=marine sediment metagenome TaxID=412755 RepID=A0A0F9SUT9_9ZZZZ